MNDLQAFALLVQALAPWRGQLVFIGGWAHRLHRFDPRANTMDIQVANPLCFMVQKFLIQKYRSAPKQAQDLLYIYDTIELFGSLLPDFSSMWKSVIKPELHELSDDVLKAVNSTFSSVNDVIRAAARIPQDRQLSPEQIQVTCQLAFEQIIDA